jgi:hypothetical protein
MVFPSEENIPIIAVFAACESSQERREVIERYRHGGSKKEQKKGCRLLRKQLKFCS